MIKHEEDDDDDNGDGLVLEMAKLRHEQESLEEDLKSMSRRLKVTERRPQQMMTFLCKVVEDPQFLPQIMLNRHLIYDDSSTKWSKIVSAAASSSSSSSGMAVSGSSAKSGEGLDGRISWRGGKSSVDYCLQSSPASEDERFGVSMIMQEHHSHASLSSSSNVDSSCGGGGAVSPPVNGSGGCNSGDGVCSSYFEDLEMARQQPTPYPFSLLDGGF